MSNPNKKQKAVSSHLIAYTNEHIYLIHINDELCSCIKLSAKTLVKNDFKVPYFVYDKPVACDIDWELEEGEDIKVSDLLTRKIKFLPNYGFDTTIQKFSLGEFKMLCYKTQYDEYSPDFYFKLVDNYHDFVKPLNF